MKILYIDPVVKTATSANYHYYDGVYDELIKEHQVALLAHVPANVKDICRHNNFEPDFVVFGLGWFNHKYFNKIQGLDYPSACVLFKPQNELKEKLDFCKINSIDVLLTPNPDFAGYENITGVKSMLFPYGFDADTFYDRGLKKEYDVGFSGALHENKHYPPGAFPVENIRTKIGGLLNDNHDINVFWSSSDSQPARIPSYEEYSKKINSSKIWIATQAAFGDITPRYYEVAASGALLFCQKIPQQYEHIFKNGYNCIEFNHDLSDFNKKLTYYLNNDSERRSIVNNALEFFHDKYQWKNRASELITVMQEVIDGQ